MDICGIDINSKVNGGHIEIINGELTGILTDNAMDLVFNNIPDADNQTKKKALLKARKETMVRPLKKNNPPSVTIKEAIPVFTINHP